MGTSSIVSTLALLLAAAPVPAQPTCPPLDQRLHTEQMDHFLQLAGDRVTRPVVLFLPGTPGSRLVRRSDGDTLFGKGRVDGAKLQLADVKNREVEAQPLEQYEALHLFSEDVYKKTLQQMRDGLGSVGEVQVWPYDWRLAAGELADALQQHLATLRGRDVVIVGHSYGGFVAWRWQEAHDPAAAGVEHMVLIGAPLGGACEAVRFLMKGYRPGGGETNDWITRLGYKVLMGELRPAAFTFPSSYQLVPGEGCLEKVTVRAGAEPERTAVDPRSLEFWKSPLGREIVGDAWKELEITPAAFWAAVERAIAEASPTVPDPARRRVRNVRAFYSADNPTARQIQVFVDASEHMLHDEEVEKAGLGDDNPVVATAPGDGRVLACEPPQCPLQDACVDRISILHGHLADSEQYQSYVLYHLPTLVKALAVRSAVRQVKSPADFPGVDWVALRAEVAATGTDTAAFAALAP